MEVTGAWGPSCHAEVVRSPGGVLPGAPVLRVALEGFAPAGKASRVSAAAAQDAALAAKVGPAHLCGWLVFLEHLCPCGWVTRPRTFV